jgi:hypothetical protein
LLCYAADEAVTEALPVKETRCQHSTAADVIPFTKQAGTIPPGIKPSIRGTDNTSRR